MWNHGSMATTTRVLVLVSLAVLAVACGSDGDTSDAATNDSAVVDDGAGEATDTTQAAPPEDTAPEATEAEQAPAPESSGGGATLTLANGETFEFPTVLCSLESQMSAGSEILFTATSYDDPGLDITQFGDEGTITDVASISVYDGDFETLWEANSMFGSPVELTLDGSTIRGTGSFLPGPDLMGESVEGEVVANC